jgi:hypothetical protein
MNQALIGAGVGARDGWSFWCSRRGTGRLNRAAPRRDFDSRQDFFSKFLFFGNFFIENKFLECKVILSTQCNRSADY